MKHLLPYFKRYKLESIIAPLFKCLEACFDLTVPLIVAGIIDKGIMAGDKNYIVSRFMLLILMALLGLACSFTAQYFAAKAAVGTAAALRTELLSKIQSLSFNEIDQTGKATLITRLTSDINSVQSGVNMALRLFMRSPFIVFGALIMAFYVNRELSLVFVLVITVLFVIVFAVMKITKGLYKNVQDRLDCVTKNTNENLHGVRVIRAFGQEEKQKEKFSFSAQLLYNAQMKAGKVSAFLNPLTYVAVNSAIIGVLYLGAGKIEEGTVFSGDIIALINYIGQILIELVKLATLITLIARSMASMSRVGAVLDKESSLSYGTVSDFPEAEEAVRFENVSFRYSGAGADSLSDISFTVKKGETVGIIGGTGSGKTTLINLIKRFYDVTKGSVFIKGVNVKKLSEEALVKAVSVVSQKPFLFKGTVKSNLLFANRMATDEELMKALETAQAKDFVMSKADGLLSLVEEGGQNLSGGQKQRLTVARAVLADSDIIILDDSSSALDFATDAALRKALKNELSDKTVFIVSQRASSITHADKIIVLDDGRIADIGSHAELSEKSAVYREILESQHSKEDAI